MSKKVLVTNRNFSFKKSSIFSLQKTVQHFVLLLALAVLPMLSYAKIVEEKPIVEVNPFITKWNLTTSSSSGSQLSFNVEVSGNVNYSWSYVVGGVETIGSGTILVGSNNCTITGLSTAATNFTLTIQPTNFKRIYITGGPNANRLVDILQWGSVGWSSMSNAFNGCTNLGTITATDAPDLTLVTNMSYMFYGCTRFQGSINSWNTVNVTNMSYMFYEAGFRGNIATWNTANVTNMSNMFFSSSFNGNISSWNTSNVTNMSSMFRLSYFNQDISNWNTANVTDMSYMFANCSDFNQNIGSWNTIKVTNMTGMFSACLFFNQNIGNWNTANVTNMSYIFNSCTNFNQNISSWNTAKVTNMGNMFANATAFNQNISNWNVASVTSMLTMFSYATAFNQNISNWNVANVTNMAEMFNRATAFNQNISNWNTAKVTNMSYMFFGAAAFNQNIGSCALNAAVNLTFMLNASGMDCANYTGTLLGWAANTSTPSNRSLGATGRNYGTNAVAARSILLGKGWTIAGDIASTGNCYPTTTWVGNTNNSWGTATNWSTGIVPTKDYNVTIATGTTNVTIVSSTQSVNALTINTGTNVNLLDTLKVAGALLINDTIRGIGKLFLNGTSNQNITGIGTVENMEINSSSTVEIVSGVANKLHIIYTLTSTAGTLTTNGNLVLKSSAAGTARIAPIAGIITGDVTQERYIPAKAARTYSLVASPFTQAISSSWQQQIHITGAGTGGTVCPTLTAHANGFDATVTNVANMFVYDGLKPVGTRWTSVTGTDINLAPGTGYRMNIRGPRSIGCSLLDGTASGLVPTEVTLSSTGSLSTLNKNMGSFTISYSNNGNATNSNDNYLMVGNPYPSEISFSKLRTDNGTKINNNYSIYAPGNTLNNYAYWNGSTWTGAKMGLSDATGNIIANGQAFFVQSSTMGGNIDNLAFNENQKTASTNNGYFRQQLNAERLRIGYLLSNGTKADEIMVQFSKQGTVETINADDVVSMNSGTQTLKSVKGQKMMAINTRPFLQQDTLALNVTSTVDGNFKLSFSDFDGITHTDIYLIDRYKNTVQQVNTNNEYPFYVDKTIAATQGNQRFAVVFSRKNITTIPIAPNNNIRFYPNPVKDKLTIELPASSGKTVIRLLDIAGKVLQQYTSKDVQAIDMSKMASGTYLLEITNEKGEKTIEKIIK